MREALCIHVGQAGVQVIILVRIFQIICVRRKLVDLAWVGRGGGGGVGVGGGCKIRNTNMVLVLVLVSSVSFSWF